MQTFLHHQANNPGRTVFPPADPFGNVGLLQSEITEVVIRLEQRGE
jgi:hypothetical protein